MSSMKLHSFRAPDWVGGALRGLLIGLLAVVIFGPLLNMLIWTVTEAWYFPAKLPVRWGFAFWGKVFKPEAGAMVALWTSLVIAVWTVLLSLATPSPSAICPCAACFYFSSCCHKPFQPWPFT